MFGKITFLLTGSSKRPSLPDLGKGWIFQNGCAAFWNTNLGLHLA